MESKNGDVNVITFVSTSLLYFFLYSNYPFFASLCISFPSSQKTVKATNKLYRREMTLSVKIKKKMDFPVPFSYYSPLLSFFLTNAEGDFMINNKRKLPKIFEQSSKVSRNFLKANFSFFYKFYFPFFVFV